MSTTKMSDYQKMSSDQTIKLNGPSNFDTFVQWLNAMLNTLWIFTSFAEWLYY